MAKKLGPALLRVNVAPPGCRIDPLQGREQLPAHLAQAGCRHSVKRHRGLEVGLLALRTLDVAAPGELDTKAME